MVITTAATLGACAAKAPSLADRFVLKGVPVTDFGGTKAQASKSRATRPAIEQRIAEVSRYSPSASSLEAHNPALKAALDAVAAAPTFAHYLDAAQAYQGLGVLDRAHDYLQMAVTLDPHSAAANDSLARLWRDWRMPGLGLANAHRAVYASPRSATARHTLGTLLYAMGLHAEAEKAFREAAALDPHAWYAWQNLCTVAMAGGRTKDAIPLCQRADAEHEAARKQPHP